MKGTNPIKGTFPIEQFRQIETPFYYYDTALLRQTLKTIVEESGRYERFHVHYAIKANANPKILSIIGQAGLGADCVSGGEIKAAIAAGIPGKKVVFAGVGKSDWEIETGLKHNIQCGEHPRVGCYQRIGCSAEQDRTHRFPHQSQCGCTYPCQHHHGIGRE